MCVCVCVCGVCVWCVCVCVSYVHQKCTTLCVMCGLVCTLAVQSTNGTSKPYNDQSCCVHPWLCIPMGTYTVQCTCMIDDAFDACSGNCVAFVFSTSNTQHTNTHQVGVLILGPPFFFPSLSLLLLNPFFFAFSLASLPPRKCPNQPCHLLWSSEHLHRSQGFGD